MVAKGMDCLHYADALLPVSRRRRVHQKHSQKVQSFTTGLITGTRITNAPQMAIEIP